MVTEPFLSSKWSSFIQTALFQRNCFIYLCVTVCIYVSVCLLVVLTSVEAPWISVKGLRRLRIRMKCVLISETIHDRMNTVRSDFICGYGFSLHWLHHPDSLFEFDSSCHHNKHNGQCFFSTKLASERRFSKPLRGNGPKCVRGAACAVSKCVNVSVTGVGVLGRNMDSFTLRLIVLKLYFIK